MLANVLVYSSAAAVTFWGAAHLVHTGPVVAGFGPLSTDHRRVLTMEWILEGVTLCFIGALVSVVTAIAGPEGPNVALVYRACAVLLLTMAGVSLFTGARAAQLPYKLCPVIFNASALLLFLGSIV